MASLITPLDDLTCPKFDNQFFAWLNTLKANQQALCEAIDNFSVSTITLLDVPVYVYNISQDRASGSVDSGTVTVAVNSIAGVTVPADAKAVILRCFSGVDGQQQAGGTVASLFTYSHIEVAGSAADINGGTFFEGMAVPTLVTYADTNLFACDNDDTNEVTVPLVSGTFAYRARVRFNDTFGIDVSRARIAVVGFLT